MLPHEDISPHLATAYCAPGLANIKGKAGSTRLQAETVHTHKRYHQYLQKQMWNVLLGFSFTVSCTSAVRTLVTTVPVPWQMVHCTVPVPLPADAGPHVLMRRGSAQQTVASTNLRLLRL